MKIYLLAATCLTGLANASVAMAQSSSAGTESGAEAQDDSGISLQDIVVTAQRRNERLQDVPVAVTAVTSERLASAGVSSVQDLTLIAPGLTMPQTQGYAQPRIRGVGATTNGPGLEQPVATYIDGVYIAAATTALLSLNNVERIEVLKGPQGTLFGRNATGGLVQVVTKDPSFDPTMNFNVSYGNFEHVQADAYVAGGLSDNLSADIAVRYEHQGDGPGRNLANGDPILTLPHDFAGRIKFLFKPGEATNIRLTADYQNRESTREVAKLSFDYPSKLPANVVTFGPFPQGGKYDTNRDTTGRTGNEGGGASLQIDHDFGNLMVQSISAYRKTVSTLLIDLDGTPLPISVLDGRAPEKQFSQELQLSSGASSALKWVAGIYYFNGSSTYDPLDVRLIGAGRILRTEAKQATDAVAGYAQATYEILPATSLTLGGRYNYERKELSGTSSTLNITTGAPLAPNVAVPNPALGIPDKLTFKRFNYRIALDHKFTPDILGYISYNTGFKSGGYNLNNTANPPYQPEDIKAAEIGLKTQLFDRRLRLNGAAYYYDYKNIQVGRYTNIGLSIYNGPAAEVYGFDLDGELRVTRDFTISGGMAYNHSKFTDFPNADYIVPCGGITVVPPTQTLSCSANGNALPYAPRFTFNASADYKVELPIGSLATNVTYFRSSRFYVGADNVVAQSPYGLLNASISWTDRSGHLSATVWGKNLTDSYYFQAATETNSSIGIYNALPRTYGVSIGYRY